MIDFTATVTYQGLIFERLQEISYMFLFDLSSVNSLGMGVTFKSTSYGYWGLPYHFATNFRGAIVKYDLDNNYPDSSQYSTSNYIEASTVV